MRNPIRKRWALALVRADGTTTEVERYWLRSSAVMAANFVRPGVQVVLDQYQPETRVGVVRSA